MRFTHRCEELVLVTVAILWEIFAQPYYMAMDIFEWAFRRVPCPKVVRVGLGITLGPFVYACMVLLVCYWGWRER